MGEQVVAGFYGGVAQLGEHLPCKQGVKSSNLSISIRCNSRGTDPQEGTGDTRDREADLPCTLKTAY